MWVVLEVSSDWSVSAEWDPTTTHRLANYSWMISFSSAHNLTAFLTQNQIRQDKHSQTSLNLGLFAVFTASRFSSNSGNGTCPLFYTVKVPNQQNLLLHLTPPRSVVWLGPNATGTFDRPRLQTLLTLLTLWLMPSLAQSH